MKITPDNFWLSLSEGLIGEKYIDKLGNHKNEVISNVTEFVTAQLSSLPRQLQFALCFGLFVFKIYVFIVTLKGLSALTIKRRSQIIELWASGKISLTRKLFRPIRSLTVLAFFEQFEIFFLSNNMND